MRARSLQGAAFCRRLGDGELQMQRCGECDRLQYPPAEVCRQCLSDDLHWQQDIPRGKVIGCVAVHRSYADDFANDGPWWVASVSLGSGVVCYTHTLDYLSAGSEVHLVAIKDRLGDGVLGSVQEINDHAALQAKFG